MIDARDLNLGERAVPPVTQPVDKHKGPSPAREEAATRDAGDAQGGKGVSTSKGDSSSKGLELVVYDRHDSPCTRAAHALAMERAFPKR